MPKAAQKGILHWQQYCCPGKDATLVVALIQQQIMKANPEGHADAILIIIMITMKVNRRQFLSRTHNNGYN